MKVDDFGGKSLRRGLRRHHRFRMRRHAGRLLLRFALPLPGDAHWLRRAVRMRGDTYTTCSGRCCGNPRGIWGDITRQERLALLRFEEAWSELGECLDALDGHGLGASLEGSVERRRGDQRYPALAAPNSRENGTAQTLGRSRRIARPR
jgi:hypothetical protein